MWILNPCRLIICVLPGAAQLEGALVTQLKQQEGKFKHSWKTSRRASSY